MGEHVADENDGAIDGPGDSAPGDAPDIDRGSAPEIDWSHASSPLPKDPEYEEEVPRRLHTRLIAAGVALVSLLLLVAGGLWLRDDGGSGLTSDTVADPVATVDEATTEPPVTDSGEADGDEDPGDGSATVTDTNGSEQAIDTEPAVETTAAPTTDPEPSTTESAVAPMSTTTAPTTTEAAAPYDTLPDGSPVPIVVVFDENRITLSGAVPSQRAQDRLRALALANAKPGQGDEIVDETVVVPEVPIGVGVRVLELTAARFPAGSTDVVGDHAAELDRIANVMNALPNVTAIVVSHADQRGGEEVNFAISADRAEAVVDYLAAQGIAPDRLASRAVGENDLITLENNEIAHELNRRTEFILYGVLIE